MIFVTGGTGLVGSHLLHDLVKKGLRVKALRRKESSLEEVKKIFSYYSANANELFSLIDWVEGDLLDVLFLSEAMEGITHVYHCGAIVSMDPADGEKMIRTNVTGTANVMNIALEKKVQKMCYVSSVASLGIEHGENITEETAWNDESNFSAYSISKYLSENEVWRASQEGLNVVIVNPTIIIGPGNWNRSSGLVFKTANAGLRWYSSGGMGYVDVRDVVKAMLLLMESETVNQRFIVSSENISFRNFFELVYSSLGKPVPNKKAGKFILELAWRADRFRSRVSGSTHYFTKDVARYASIHLSYSAKKIKNLFEIDFIPVSEAVKSTSKRFISDLDLKKK
jgi:dihydroflavonol-4-reductase